MSMANLGQPPLPHINDTDLVLAVFTHESLQSEANDEHFGDPKRLAYLGRKVLDQAISYHYFMKKPTMSLDEIEVQIGYNYPNFVQLLHDYGLRNKITSDPSWHGSIDSSEVAENFFHKYIGALYLQHGLATVQDWISQLLDPGLPSPPLPAANVRQHQPIFQPQPPPPNQPPPPPPPYLTSQSNILIPQPPPPVPISNNNNYQILAQFNMTAHQRGYTVTYPARSEGPHHTPIWHVQCRLNEELRGEGTGKNQKQAKEMAARQAWVAMGWGQLPD